MVHFNVAHVGGNHAKKLTRSLATEAVNAVDASVQQLGHDVVDHIRQGLERAYSTVCLLSALTRISGVAAFSILCMGEGRGSAGKYKRTKGGPSKTFQGATKAPLPYRSSNGGIARC